MNPVPTGRPPIGLATVVATALGVALAAIGAIGTVSPALLVQFARPLLSPGPLYGVAAIRVAFGIVLLLAAPPSRMPRTVRALGVFLIVAGVLTPVLGAERALAILEWWSGQPDSLMRAWSGAAVAFGLFVAYAVRRRLPA